MTSALIRLLSTETMVLERITRKPPGAMPALVTPFDEAGRHRVRGNPTGNPKEPSIVASAGGSATTGVSLVDQ